MSEVGWQWWAVVREGQFRMARWLLWLNPILTGGQRSYFPGGGEKC